MFRFFSEFKVLAVLAILLTAACGTEPRSAGAQDLAMSFLAKTPDARPQVRARPSREFSAADPARVMVIGDSLADGFGIFLDRRVRERDLNARVYNYGRVSSGLARSDFYNWPERFEELAGQYRPDVVVVHFGSNDMQTIILPDSRVGFGTEEWDAAYRQQTRRILDIAARYGAVVYWLGPAPDRNSKLNRHLSRINPLFQAEAELVRANYIPLSAFTAGENGEFVKTTSVAGRVVTIRSGDGSHFTGAGYYLVADHILKDMEGRMPSVFTGPVSELAGALQ